MKRKILCLNFIISALFIFCQQDVSLKEIKSFVVNVAMEQKVIHHHGSSFLLKSKNLIYDNKEQKIILPVFKGENGDLNYNEFLNYYQLKRILRSNQMENSFVIPCKQNQVKKTFQEFLKFYKGNILKDIDISVPVNMVIDGSMWIMDYNFTVNGVPCSMTIEIVSDDSDTFPVDKWLKYKTVYQITPYEKNKDPYFSYSISIGSHVEKIKVNGQNLGGK